MVSLNKIRRVGAIFFEILSILIIAFYSSLNFLSNHPSTKNGLPLFQPDATNPIVYYKASENLSYTESLPKVQAIEHSSWDISFDLPSLKIGTSEALFVAASLRNVFYVFISINAP